MGSIALAQNMDTNIHAGPLESELWLERDEFFPRWTVRLSDGSEPKKIPTGPDISGETGKYLLAAKPSLSALCSKRNRQRFRLLTVLLEKLP